MGISLLPGGPGGTATSVVGPKPFRTAISPRGHIASRNRWRSFRDGEGIFEGFIVHKDAWLELAG